MRPKWRKKGKITQKTGGVPRFLLQTVEINGNFEKIRKIFLQVVLGESKFQLLEVPFKHLLNNAKMNSLFDDMVGYIWSLEYGPERGFHYHLVMFFNSAEVKNDVYLAWQIGEYWQWVITNGRGSYWNCNDKKAGYHHLGIGMIHYSDVEKISNLKQAAAYLIKVNHYVRMLTPDNGRTFGRGEILPPRTSTVGRPRAA